MPVSPGMCCLLEPSSDPGPLQQLRQDKWPSPAGDSGGTVGGPDSEISQGLGYCPVTSKTLTQLLRALQPQGNCGQTSEPKGGYRAPGGGVPPQWVSDLERTVLTPRQGVWP